MSLFVDYTARFASTALIRSVFFSYIKHFSFARREEEGNIACRNFQLCILSPTKSLFEIVPRARERFLDEKEPVFLKTRIGRY